jgi:hypothetical protein
VGRELESGCDSIEFVNEIFVGFKVENRAMDRVLGRPTLRSIRTMVGGKSIDRWLVLLRSPRACGIDNVAQ